jgi:hypothetical protein
MFPVRIDETPPPQPDTVVAAFNGEAERFVLRAFRLFQRSLMQLNGDAGTVLGKHLRARIPGASVDQMLSDLTSLVIEIHFLRDQPHATARGMAKWPSKQEFFLIALIEASQRRDKARATEAAIALLDTFEVGGVLEASAALARRLEEFGLRLMPIGDAAFTYFADYKPLDGPLVRPVPLTATPEASPLRLVGSGYGRRRE